MELLNGQPPVYDIANLRCCITCVIAQENGDTSALNDSELETWQNGVMATDALNGGWEWSGVQCDSFNEYGDACDCDGGDEEHMREGWFSWSPCEFCGDTDGGNRFNVAIMRKVV